MRLPASWPSLVALVFLASISPALQFLLESSSGGLMSGTDGTEYGVYFSAQESLRPKAQEIRPRRSSSALTAASQSDSSSRLPPLQDLYDRLEKRSTCNTIIDTALTNLLLNQSVKSDYETQSIWLARLLSKHTYLAATKSIPLNGTITSQPAVSPLNRSISAVYVLQLLCTPAKTRPRWTPTAVFPTALAGSYLQLRLPPRELNTCLLSGCTTKCTYTVHGGVRIYARSCCAAENRAIDGRLTAEGWPNDQTLCRDDYRRLRLAFSMISALFALASLLMIALVIRERRRQQQEARGWALVEPMFLGATFLYAIPLLDWYYASDTCSCIVVVWLREIGFALFYGSLVFKILRNLQECRVRKAHHVVVREHDLLKYLAAFTLLTLSALTAWSLGSTKNSELRHALWPQCPFEEWTVMWASYELLFLLYGAWLCYKAISSSWVERYQFTLAILVEALVTLVVNLIRYSLREEGSADALFILMFVHLHLTISVNIAAIVGPKLLLGVESTRRTMVVTGMVGDSRAHPSLAKIRDNLINGTIDLAEVPIVDMNPEDIRAELKRVYTQLRMFKLKNAYQDNPHISKRKGGGKKTYEKTGKNRRISIPPTCTSNATNTAMGTTAPSPKMSKLLEEEESTDMTVESSHLTQQLYLTNTKIPDASSNASTEQGPYSVQV